MTASVSEHRWRQAQRHELDFWEHWRELPAYQGLVLNSYWAGERIKFALPPDFFAGRRVLDVGCGPVGLVHFLPEAGARVRLYPLLVKYGGCLPLAEPQLSLAAAGEDLPLASASVDVCICFNAFDHMRNPQAALAEIHRVLRPHGTLLAMVHSFPAWVLPLLWPDRLHPHHWTHQAAARLLNRHFHVTHAHRARRQFQLPLRAMLMPSGWKYTVGNFVLWSSYFTAERPAKKKTARSLGTSAAAALGSPLG